MVEPSTLRSILAALLATVWLSGCAAAGESPTRSAWTSLYRELDREAGSPAASTEPVSEVGSLDEVLREAETRNPGLRAAFDRWTAALEQVPQAKSLPDPRISYAHFVESVETRVGPQRQKFGITQTIPLFGKLGLRGDVARLAAQAVGARFEQERLDVRYRVARLWNDYYYLHRAIAVTEENLRLMTYLENVALAQYSAGKTPHASVIRAQVELGKLEVRLRTLEDQQTPYLASLNAELNRPPHSSIAWPDSLRYQPVLQSRQELGQILLEDNPQIAALRYMVEKEAAAAKLAGKSPIPDLTLGAEYIDIDDSVFPNVPESGKNAAIAKATISIPLWFGRYRAERAQANARRSATQRELTQLQNRLAAELDRALFVLRDAERRVELYAGTLLPKARQSLEVTEVAFTAGHVSFLDLVDAQRTLLEFDLAYERALADRATTYAHFEKIVGRDLAME